MPSTTPPISAPFNPPTQSRVLAFSQAQHRNNILSPSGQHPISPAGIIGSQPSPKPLHPGRGQPSPLVPDLTSRNSVGSLGDSATQRIQSIENLGTRPPFSPFDNGTAGAVDGPTASGYTSSRQPSVDLHGGFNAVDALLPGRDPRLSPQTLLTSGISSQTGTHDSTPSPSSSFASGRGSRFAKFWEKSKEAGGNNAGPGMGGFPPTGVAAMLSQQGVPAPPQSVSPSVSQQGRQPDLGPSNVNGFPGNASIDNIQDMLAMLQNSQGARVNHRPSIPQHLHALHEQQIPHHQPQPQHHFSNANNILDHQFDNNRPSFVPDGLVPGLRPARNRDGSIYTSDGIDDTAPTPPFSIQPRQGQGQQQQQQQFDRQTPGIGGLPQIYNSQNASVGMGGGRMFQPPFRAEPSPLNPVNPNTLQRLPPGLANLGGRPPHDPSAYVNGGVVPGLGVGMGLGGLDGPGNAVGGGALQHQQQAFNGFGGNANPSGNFGGPIGMGGMGMSGLGAIGGMNVGASLGVPGGQRGGVGGGQAPLPIQTLLNPNGNAMLSPTGHHPEFTVQQHHPHHPHHHHHPSSVGLRGPPQGLQNQQSTPHGPPPPGISVRSAFGQPGAPGSVGLSPAIQAQLGLRQQQQQQQQAHHILPGMIPPPQMQHLAQQQPGGLHGLHHGHGHGQAQNEHLLSMLMGGLAQRE
ncbi:hypothetical protein Clacol_008038 [Clathrus columnatus]|uniref:Uncharacterized protein n=1 Tax=Clathrus columnatus TaxID=1419009 RepID=A0AAV5ALH1_9AGAM|nr:hypothetical protein Clacol_008038 [Clathrus columnatus]